jgi:hypothetical protein
MWTLPPVRCLAARSLLAHAPLEQTSPCSKTCTLVFSTCDNETCTGDKTQDSWSELAGGALGIMPIYRSLVKCAFAKSHALSPKQSVIAVTINYRLSKAPTRGHKCG